MRPALENWQNSSGRAQNCAKPCGAIRMRILKKLAWQREDGTTQPSGEETSAIEIATLQKNFKSTTDGHLVLVTDVDETNAVIINF